MMLMKAEGAIINHKIFCCLFVIRIRCLTLRNLQVAWVRMKNNFLVLLFLFFESKAGHGFTAPVPRCRRLAAPVASKKSGDDGVPRDPKNLQNPREVKEGLETEMQNGRANGSSTTNGAQGLVVESGTLNGVSKVKYDKSGMVTDQNEGDDPQNICEIKRDLDDEQIMGSEPSKSFWVELRDALVSSAFLRLDTFKMKSRILGKRSYARPEPFKKENFDDPPVLEDMLPEPPRPEDSFYLSIPVILLTFAGTTAIFPFLATYLDTFVDMPSDQLDAITSKFVPGVSILYGTYISLTLSILYNRQKDVQDVVAKETALLGFILHNFVALFKLDRSSLVEATQCVADQVRVLMVESRGLEYMTIVYTDPYIRMLEIVSGEEERMVRDHGDLLCKGPVLNTCRDTIREMRTLRATRLSNEALSLPPTHFLILQALTFLILFGYVTSVLPTVNKLGSVPFEISFLFGVLTSTYLLFYCVAADLNDLYSGVFQLRRGSSASHMNEIRYLISNHPWLCDGAITFECSTEMRSRNPDRAEQYAESDQGFGMY